MSNPDPMPGYKTLEELGLAGGSRLPADLVQLAQPLQAARQLALLHDLPEDGLTGKRRAGCGAVVAAIVARWIADRPAERACADRRAAGKERGMGDGSRAQPCCSSGMGTDSAARPHQAVWS